MFGYNVWFTMGIWSKSVQSGTRFSLPSFVFTSKEVNYFFLWTRFCELMLSETAEFRLKMKPRLNKKSYEMHPDDRGWLSSTKYGARTIVPLDFSAFLNQEIYFLLVCQFKLDYLLFATQRILNYKILLHSMLDLRWLKICTIKASINVLCKNIRN